MTQLRFIPATFAASAVFLFSSLSSAIVAPPAGCGTGPACGVGFECTVVGESGCASAAPCAPGSSCPEPEPCATTTVLGCTPAHCMVDAECATGMVCHTWTESCPVTDCACAPNTPDCGCGGVSACEPKSVSMCTPRYLLPCEAASDCGEGFNCEEQMTGCATAGSNGSGPTPSGDAAPAPAGGAAGDPIEPIPACSPQPTGVFQCVAKPLMCATAAQCPAGWTCESAVTTAPAPACAPGSDCANAGALPAPSPEAWCRPPYYGVDSSGGLETPTTPTTGTGNTGSTGSGTGTGTGGGGSTTGVPPQPETTNADDATSHDSAACQMGHAPASSGVLSLLTLLGALLGLKRRRS
jgi:hypothetical protein